MIVCVNIGVKKPANWQMKVEHIKHVYHILLDDNACYTIILSLIYTIILSLISKSFLIIKVFIESSMPCSVGSSLLCPVLMSLDYVRRPHRLTDCACWGLFKYTHVMLTWKQSSRRKWNEAFSEPISSVKTHHWMETFDLHVTVGGTYCCHSSVETFDLHVMGGGTHCYHSFYLVDRCLGLGKMKQSIYVTSLLCHRMQPLLLSDSLYY